MIEIVEMVSVLGGAVAAAAALTEAVLARIERHNRFMGPSEPRA
jgi:hypothetical protein